MKNKRKFLIIGVLCITVLAATIGGFAIASASDVGNERPLYTAVENLMDKVADIYEQNTGTSIDSQELQKAFEQTQTELRSSRLDTLFENLVEEGKITQEQADEWRIWWEYRPSGLGDNHRIKIFRNGGVFNFNLGKCLPGAAGDTSD